MRFGEAGPHRTELAGVSAVCGALLLALAIACERTNGTEPTALAAFDIQRYRPELVHIEVIPGNQGKILKYFHDNGYELIGKYLKYEVRNWYFKPAEED